MKTRDFPTLVLLLLGLAAWQIQASETWVSSKGDMFEASVQKVVPGQVTFILKDGREQVMPLSGLSDSSRTKLVKSLGFGDVQATQAASPSPAAAPAPVVAQPTADGTAIDVTDKAQIDSRMGQPTTVVGTVSEVVKLGATGHRIITFEGTAFNFFISKQALEKSSDWIIDDLPGKRLQVTGTLETYREAAQIRGLDPAQLTRITALPKASK